MSAKQKLATTEDFILYGEIEPVNKEVYIHIDYLAPKWTKTVYIRMLEAWAEIVEWFASNEVPALFVLLKEDDLKTIKFEEKFGFYIEKQAEGYVRMRLDL